MVEVVVIGIKHGIENEWPRAYVRLKEGKKATEEELKKYVSGLKIIIRNRTFVNYFNYK